MAQSSVTVYLLDTCSSDRKAKYLSSAFIFKDKCLLYGSDVKIVDSFLMNVQQRHVIKSRLRHSSSQIGLKTPKTAKTSFSCGAGSGTTNSSCSRRSTSQKSDRTSAGFFRNKSAKDAMLATDSDLQEHRLGSMRSCNSRRPRSNS